MYQLIYSSKAVADLTSDDLIFLTNQSHAKNKAQDISGLLLFYNGCFFQVLEGQENDINYLWNIIALDKRHKNLVMHEHTAIEHRHFQSWTIGIANLPAHSPTMSSKDFINKNLHQSLIDECDLTHFSDVFYTALNLTL